MWAGSSTWEPALLPSFREDKSRQSLAWVPLHLPLLSPPRVLEERQNLRLPAVSTLPPRWRPSWPPAHLITTSWQYLTDTGPWLVIYRVFFTPTPFWVFFYHPLFHIVHLQKCLSCKRWAFERHVWLALWLCHSPPCPPPWAGMLTCCWWGLT